MASGRPTVVCVTSGTAAAELHPVVPGRRGGVPLIVCTADRPPELHDTGVPQTIARKWASSGRRPAGPAPPECRAKGRRTAGGLWRWRPRGGAPRASGPARCTSTGTSSASHGLTGGTPGVGGTDRRLPGRGSARGPAAPLFEALQGRGIVIAGGRGAQPPESLPSSPWPQQLGWPPLGGPAPREPGSKARSPLPMPSSARSHRCRRPSSCWPALALPGARHLRVRRRRGGCSGDRGRSVAALV